MLGLNNHVSSDPRISGRRRPTMDQSKARRTEPTAFKIYPEALTRLVRPPPTVSPRVTVLAHLAGRESDGRRASLTETWSWPERKGGGRRPPPRAGSAEPTAGHGAAPGQSNVAGGRRPCAPRAPDTRHGEPPVHPCGPRGPLGLARGQRPSGARRRLTRARGSAATAR